MTISAIKWLNSIAGAVEVTIDGKILICRNLDELRDFLSECGSRLNAGSASSLGVLAFYFALRDFGSGRQSAVLDRAVRALDAAYVVVEDSGMQAHISDGIDAVREHLFTIRGSSHEELVQRAYHYMRSRLRE